MTFAHILYERFISLISYSVRPSMLKSKFEIADNKMRFTISLESIMEAAFV